MASAQPIAETRSGIVRDALGIGIASCAYAISFGAISTTAGYPCSRSSLFQY